jgi:radical SAM-linked protein
MVFESTSPAPPAPPPAPVRDKVRIRFRKDGALRWLSHHDLMRTLERMLRRAELPMHCTQGFNPRPRMVFALSLPLGVVGCQEVVELELEQVLPLEEVQERLFRQAPPGLTLLSLRRVSPKGNAQVCRLSYRLGVPPDRMEGLADKVAAVLAAKECWVERKRPQRAGTQACERRIDVRPFLADLCLPEVANLTEPLAVPVPGATHALEMTLWLTPEGTARPDEVLGLVGLQDLLPAGVVLERSRLELHDEMAPTSPTTDPGQGRVESTPWHEPTSF